MSFNPVPPVATRRVLGLDRRATTGDTFAGLRDAQLYRAAPGSNELTKVTNFPMVTLSTQFIDLAATDTELFILRDGDVLRCDGTCEDYSEFSSVYSVPSGPQVTGICARGTAVYFVAQQVQTTQLYGVDRSGSVTFTQRVADLGTAYGEDCFIDENGHVYVAGDNGVAVRFSTGGTSVEPLDMKGQAAARWTSVAVGQMAGVMVGGGSGMRVARRTGGAWAVDPIVNTGPLLSAALLLAPGEFVLAGESPAVGTTTIYKSNGGPLGALTPAPPVMNVHRGVVVGDDELYLGGTNGNDSAYVILHGTR